MSQTDRKDGDWTCEVRKTLDEESENTTVFQYLD